MKEEIPEFTFPELAALKLNKKDPSKWISARMLAMVWGISFNQFRQIVHKKKFDLAPLKLANKSFYLREEALGVYIPEDFLQDDEERGRFLARSKKLKLSKSRNQAVYIQAMSENVSLEDWGKIIKKAVDDAILGDYRARQWIGSYLVGTPIQRLAVEARVTDERFSEGDRALAAERLLGGLLGDSRILEAVIPNSTEADGSASEGGSTVDASSE